MPTISMADKDFEQWYKNYVAEGQSVSLWEQALTGLQQAYKPQISAVQQSSAYDISQAYANYKKSQLNLMQAQQLGTGLKEQLSSGLGQQYQSAYQQTKATEAQQLASLAGAYTEDVATVEKQFSQFGETASQLQKALFEYAQSGAGVMVEPGKKAPEIVNYEYQRAFIPVSEGGLGYYSLSEDGTYELTEAGEAFYDKLLGQYATKYNTAGERVTTSFGDWLLENEDYAELGKAYNENPALFAEAFGGKRVSDLEVTEKEQTYRDANEAEKTFEKQYPEYYDENQQFESDAERENYYTTLAEQHKKIDDWRAGAKGLSFIENQIKSKYNIKDIDIDITAPGELGDYAMTLTIFNPDKYLSENDISVLKAIGFSYVEPANKQSKPALKIKNQNKDAIKRLLTELQKVNIK